MIKRIFPLTLGGLGIGTTEFVMMGILPNISSSLQISIPKAGSLISAYALGVVLGAPLLVWAMRRFNYKISLIILSVIFLIFNGVCALVNEYNFLLFLRFLSGLPHGAFFGIGSVVAANSVPNNKRARAVSLMFLGLTGANLLTVPLGTYLANEYSWQYTFYLISLIGLITLLALIFFLPPSSQEKATYSKSFLSLFRKREPWIILSMTAIGTAGTFAWISYVVPLMMNVTKISQSQIAQIMILIGAGMVIGNIVGGFLSDRLEPSKACMILLLSISMIFLIIYFVADTKILVLTITFIAASLSMAIAAPIQILIMSHATASPTIAAASTQAAFNIANSLGALLGGIPLTLGYNFKTPLLVACSLALIGGIIAYKLIRIERINTIERSNMLQID